MKIILKTVYYPYLTSNKFLVVPDSEHFRLRLQRAHFQRGAGSWLWEMQGCKLRRVLTADCHAPVTHFVSAADSADKSICY